MIQMYSVTKNKWEFKLRECSVESKGSNSSLPNIIGIKILGSIEKNGISNLKIVTSADIRAGEDILRIDL